MCFNIFVFSVVLVTSLSINKQKQSMLYHLLVSRAENDFNDQAIYLPLKLFHEYYDNPACIVKISCKLKVLVRVRLCDDVNIINSCVVLSPVIISNENKYFGYDDNICYNNTISEKDIQRLKTKKPASSLNVTLVGSCITAVNKFKNDTNLAKKIAIDILVQYFVTKNCIISCKGEKYSNLNSIVINDIVGKPCDVYEINANTVINISKIVSYDFYVQMNGRNNFFERHMKVFLPSDEDEKVPTYVKINKLVSNFVKNSTSSETSHKSLLIIGPSGCAKTIIVNTIAFSLKKIILKISCKQINSINFIEQLKTIIVNAKAHVLAKEECIILLKDIDYICHLRNEQTSAKTLLLAKQIKLVLEEIDNLLGIAVIATSSNPENITPMLRSFGCFNLEIEIPMLIEDDRENVYQIMASIYELPCSYTLYKSFAKWTLGYVFADILLVIREAVNLFTKNKDLSEENQIKYLKKSVSCNLASTLRGTRGLISNNKILFNDIGGMENVKKTLRMSIQWQMENPEAFARLGISPTRGVLLYGPPGCAKTTLVKALAHEANVTFIAASAADIYSPYVGEAEKKLAKLFMQARIGAPSILFIDEIDALVGSKDGNRESGVQERILATLLIEMDGVGINLKTDDTLTKITDQDSSCPVSRSLKIINNSRVIVVGATNRPDKIDDALKRPGRFDKLIHIPAPSLDERLQILQKFISKMSVTDDIDLKLIADKTDRFSGADLKSLCMESALYALSARGMDTSTVTQEDFIQVLKSFRSSLINESCQ